MLSLPPELTERYELRGSLGQGGMGEVLSCWDRKLGRAVAIKLMRDDRVRREDLRRFEREARLISGLSSPGVVRIFDAGLSGTDSYLVMEKLEGLPLDARLAPGVTLKEAEVERLLRVMLVTLAEVHDAGVLHRDIKPGNIFLRDGKEPVLLDFGIARQVQPSTELTDAGSFVGTLRYVAPEILTSALYSPRSDLFSLALTCLECLVDMNVHTGGPRDERVSSVDLISGLTSGTYVWHAQRALTRRSRLVDVILAAIAHRPEHRPASARLMLVALDGAPPPAIVEDRITSQTEIARPTADRGPSTSRRSRSAAAGALALTACALAAVAGVVRWTGPRPAIQPVASAVARVERPADAAGGMVRFARWAEEAGLSRRAADLAHDLTPPRSRKESYRPAVELVDLGIAAFGAAADRQLPTTAELAHDASYRRLFELAALDAVTQRVSPKSGGALSCFPEDLRPGAARPAGGRVVEVPAEYKDWLTPDPMLDGFRLAMKADRIRHPIHVDPALPSLAGVRRIWLGLEVARVDAGTYVRVRSLSRRWEISLLPAGKGSPVVMSHRIPASWLQEGHDPLELSVWALDRDPLAAVHEPGRLTVVLEP